MFDYAEMTTRNIGFVTPAEQDRLKAATVFVCGTGGMGGACLMSLVRAGIGRLIIADIDTFDVSNLNRQVFCFDDTIGEPKAEATATLCRKINPTLDLTVYDDEWPEHVEAAISQADVVVNGTDDLGATLLLYRTARRLGKTMIDAYASPFPSVYVTRPDAPAHEARLQYPTQDTAWNEITNDQRAEAFLREAEHVVIHSSARHHIDLEMVGEVVAGRRSRMSFAPMVITTGQFMAYEVLFAVLDRASATDERGWAFNPYKARIERPKSAAVAAVLRPLVRRFLTRLAADA